VTGRHRVVEPVRITAGEPEHGAWCAVCQLPTRLRVPLFTGPATRPSAVLEICPGCGSGHDQSAAYIEPVPETAAVAKVRWRHAVAAALHRRACERNGLIPRDCAWGDCPWPGLWRNEVSMEGEDGTWRYVFCRKAHQRRWVAENGIVQA
jgi:hypothetical protein